MPFNEQSMASHVLSVLHHNYMYDDILACKFSGVA